MDQFYTDYEEEIGTDQYFRHGLGKSMALLFSCRQLYHEAAGVFYGQNSFVVSRVRERHDDDDDQNDNQDEYFQSVYAYKWLSSLGSQISLLRKVITHVDAVCPTTCFRRMYYIDLLPLIWLLWESPELHQVVSFGRSGRTLIVHDGLEESGSESESEGPHPVDMAKMLNNIFTAFTMEVTLSLKHYRYSAHLLNEIAIYKRRKIGCVKYKMNSGVPPMIQNLKTSDEGKIVAWEPKERLKLTKLPALILKRIHDIACFNPKGVMLDMDTKTLRGMDMSIFQVNHFL